MTPSRNDWMFHVKQGVPMATELMGTEFGAKRNALSERTIMTVHGPEEFKTDIMEMLMPALLGLDSDNFEFELIRERHSHDAPLKLVIRRILP